ncbi:MAG: hydrogenase formation protein HypD [Betaproteobacteria bacterium]|nr:hydrogenase formation protein HypD [Betaproteobacteria bacterium]
MKYIDEFRDGALAQKISANIAIEANPARSYHLMEFCGGHTHAISRYGIVDLLPDNIHMIHGPGCPVCVLPIGRVENAIQLAQTPDLILCSYGDMLRIPTATGMNLLKIKAQGADVRMVYSSADALKIAQDNPEHQVVFLAIGFETTTPPTAVAIKQAQAMGLRNFSVFCNHVLTPSAISHILQSPEVRQLGLVPLDGFIGPAHVSTVIGSQPYEYFTEEFQKPVVIAGFEPLDVMQAILMLIRQLNEGRAEVENEFSRAVLPTGNVKAQVLVADVFELRRTFEWRGLGLVPYSALKIKSAYAEFDAEKRFQITKLSIADNKACECGAILRGVKQPQDCKIFGTVCTPENPIGSCMVSSEGACAAHYNYGRLRDHNFSMKKINA